MTATDVSTGSATLGTAAQHATRRVPVCAPGDSVADVLDRLRGRRFDTAALAAVCEGERLVGLTTVERLLAARPKAVVSEVMDPDPPVVSPDAAQERAAWAAVRHDEPGLAVVDEDRRFLGLIPAQRLMGVLLAEHDEDLARLGGFLGTASAARQATVERVPRRLWHRLPWLLLGLTGAMLSAGVVGAFESLLDRQVLLAFFVPAVVYLADAVGTQTETLVVRGLSVGVPVGRVALREAVTGVLIGLLLAAGALALTVVFWGDLAVAVAVGLALFAACAVATLVAMVLPWLLSRLGTDPVYGSGPLATVVQDLLSILIYLAIASAVVP
ncbi:Mg/Co/Ni transporter MgtE with CBS domain [Saccharomonospora marina XMU15]|uniref:Mg/Co/Ni transporter MgtE with CBS domain n=1 Tax=Saccharomonospora marina XMU15 TaxID=882083 RepID=H5WYX9_9PSEU|nr:magnesium transporter [Saccharomonospora marina]EHR51851.1 Mg/Co/Ni transporter MgtE with CBS domain [Saccharomonospora marina XMU15]